MSFLSFVKKFLKATSAHGFRYVVEGSNIVEQMLWIWIISTVFVLAIIMVASNIKDTKENTISVSIDTIPVQRLPFPAVTMNSARLDHHNRLIEAVYNDVKFDCHNFFPFYDNETCQDCMKETEKAREDLLPSIKTMLARSNETYHNVCEEFLEDAKNRTESEEFLRNELMFRICWIERVRHPARALNPCMASKEIYHGHQSDVLDVMSSFFRISQCLMEDTFEELGSVCGGTVDTEEDYYCEESVLETPSDLLCHTYGILIGSVSKSQESFLAGVALKEAYRFKGQVSPKAPNLINHLINQNEGDVYRSECLMTSLSSYDTSNDTRLDCKRENLGIDFWLQHMDLVYKFQKQLIPPTSKFGKEKSEIADVKIIKETMKNEYLYNMRNEEIVNDYATILSCKFGDLDLTTNCELFSSTFTTSGIGYTFNNDPFWTLYKNTTSNQAFYKEIYETEDGFESELPRYIVNTGQGFSLDFVIRHDSYGYRYENDKVLGDYQEVLLALHDPSKLPNLRAEGIVIQPGLFYDIRVIPSITVTDKSGLALDVTARNCLSKSDNDDLLTFNAYSQSACILECKLKKAIATCDCTGWDYPRIDESVKICVNNTENNNCFLEIMNNDAVGNDCNCLNDCEHITYDVDLHVTALRPPKERQEAFDVDIHKSGYSFWNQLYNRFKYWDAGSVDDLFLVDDSRTGLEELSRVRVSVQAQVATKIIRSARVSFSSQLASLGGIIGLFTGMSILSLAESIYWGMKYIKHAILAALN